MTTADEFCDALLSEVGYVEEGGADGHSGNLTKFAAEAGHPNGYAWCMTFLVAIAKRTGLYVPYTGSNTLACAEAFRADGRLFQDPQRGDWVVFHGKDFPEGHIEGVVGVFPDSSLDDVGGNTSDGIHGSQWDGGGVRRRHRPRAQIVGFCRPDYEIAAPPPPKEQPVATKTVTVTTDPATGKGGPVAVPGVFPDKTYSWGALTQDDGSVAKVGLNKDHALDGTVQVNVDLGVPSTLAPVDVRVVVGFNA